MYNRGYCHILTQPRETVQRPLSTEQQLINYGYQSDDLLDSRVSQSSICHNLLILNIYYSHVYIPLVTASFHFFSPCMTHQIKLKMKQDAWHTLASKSRDYCRSLLLSWSDDLNILKLDSFLVVLIVGYKAKDNVEVSTTCWNTSSMLNTRLWHC